MKGTFFLEIRGKNIRMLSSLTSPRFRQDNENEVDKIQGAPRCIIDRAVIAVSINSTSLKSSENRVF